MNKIVAQGSKLAQLKQKDSNGPPSDRKKMGRNRPPPVRTKKSMNESKLSKSSKLSSVRQVNKFDKPPPKIPNKDEEVMPINDDPIEDIKFVEEMPLEIFTEVTQEG